VSSLPSRPSSEALRPPRPRSLTPVAALVRVALQGDGDLLSLLPKGAYRMLVGPLGWSRRQTVIVNAPEHARAILADAEDAYPKSDLMVGALEPLIGDSIFVSSGDTWRRQRRMIDPAFTHMRLNAAFPAIAAAVDEHERELDRRAEGGEPFSLDLTMSHLTADVICRATFSTSLASRTAREVFEDFAVFERSVAQVELKRLILDPAWTQVPQKPEVLAACRRIRAHLGDLLDTHLAPGAAYDDIATAVIAARDPETGAAFTREELIDQLGVFFLAGHETSASALTWAFFLLATQPAALARVRAEVDATVGDGPVGIEHTKRLAYTRNVFRETLRLYPPITFLPRVALREVVIGGRRIRRGALVMISPWVMHRHQQLWRAPDDFDPDRFAGEREKEFAPGAYLPFGIGPRVCVGAAFATTEATLILARLLRRYDFEVLDADRVRPAARLTTRPAEQIRIRVARRAATAATAR
jgi:cytochrome P450